MQDDERKSFSYRRKWEELFSRKLQQRKERTENNWLNNRFREEDKQKKHTLDGEFDGEELVDFFDDDVVLEPKDTDFNLPLDE